MTIWGWMVVFFFGIAIVGFALESSRKKNLIKQYGDTPEGNAIANKQIFIGMSQWQLRDAWGSPKTTSTRVLKTKVKETWIYDAANHVYLEDGYVVGWKQRS